MATENQSRTGAKAGYVVAIVINAIMLFVIHNLVRWNVPFITERFTAVVWAFDLSIGATMVANLLYLGYDAPWFKHLTEAVTAALGFVTVYVLYTFYPFDLPAGLNPIFRLALLVAMLGTAIAIIVNLVQWVTSLLRT